MYPNERGVSRKVPFCGHVIVHYFWAFQPDGRFSGSVTAVGRPLPRQQRAQRVPGGALGPEWTPRGRLGGTYDA